MAFWQAFVLVAHNHLTETQHAHVFLLLCPAGSLLASHMLFGTVRLGWLDRCTWVLSTKQVCTVCACSMWA